MTTQQNIARILVTLFLIFLSSGLLACEARTKDEVKRQINDAIKGIKSQGGISISEVDKLYQLEYTVVSFPLTSSAQRLEGALDDLGKKRWDCFHVERSLKENAQGQKSAALLVFCKRLPETFLRYVPKQFIGR